MSRPCYSALQPCCTQYSGNEAYFGSLFSAHRRIQTKAVCWKGADSAFVLCCHTVYNTTVIILAFYQLIVNKCAHQYNCCLVEVCRLGLFALLPCYRV